MAGFVEGADRSQSTLLPALLDDYVTADNPVHAIDVFVDGLDLGKLGFTRVQPLATGRPGYRFAADRRAKAGLGKPETFNFLGFTHICGRSGQGSFLLKRRTRRDRMRTKLKAIKEELRRRMHQPIPEQGEWLA